MMSINSAQCRAEPVAVEGQQSTKVWRLLIPEFDQFCRSVNHFSGYAGIGVKPWGAPVRGQNLTAFTQLLQLLWASAVSARLARP